jgi:hypothetical protein
VLRSLSRRATKVTLYGCPPRRRQPTEFPRLAAGHLRASMAVMGVDSYWRTRTIGEAQEQGYSHLRATCSACVELKLFMGQPFC